MQLVKAVEATREMLLDVHTERYLDELSNGWQKLQEVTSCLQGANSRFLQGEQECKMVGANGSKL